MSLGKLKKFEEMATFPNVFQSHKAKQPQLRDYLGHVVSMRGQWRTHFGNNNPVVLELACGRGEYTIALARAHPNQNFVGIDVKGARIWQGAKQALDEGLRNVAFLRLQIEHLAEAFEPGEVSEIWITFPDPYPKKSKWKKRLTSSRFLDVYRRVMISEGCIHLKTDSMGLFEFTKETLLAGHHQVVEEIEDVWSMDPVPPHLQVTTYYEKMHRAEGRRIKYIKFRLSI
jgi:tRNA (guanine-N7-)-methyltransferase